MPERLIDDCIIMDYGSILIQQPAETLRKGLRKYLHCPRRLSVSIAGDLHHPLLPVRLWKHILPFDVEGLAEGKNQVPLLVCSTKM